MTDDADLVYLCRGNIDVRGELILRSELPAGAELISIRHTIDRVHHGDPDAAASPVGSVDVFLVR